MGTSTDAILAFGFDLGEELPDGMQPGCEESFDFDNWMADRLLPDLREPGHDNYKADWPDYWKKRREAVAASPVDLITHCSLDYPMYFLAVRGTELVARRGCPEAAVMPEVSAEAIATLRRFCEDNNIEWREPSWHLFSLWA